MTFCICDFSTVPTGRSQVIKKFSTWS